MKHVKFNGRLVMVGFGSIGQGVLPLILRHFECDRGRITVIDPDDGYSQLATREGCRFEKLAITEATDGRDARRILEERLGTALA